MIELIMKTCKAKQYELASIISRFACSSDSVTHLDEASVSNAPDLRTFKESHSLGNPFEECLRRFNKKTN